MKTTQVGSGESRLETTISYLLIIGVMASLVTEVAGMILMYLSYKQLLISSDPGFIIRGRDFFTFVYNQFTNNNETAAVRLMTLGIVFLMLTPYLRVIISAFYFSLRKNVKYVLITLFVLILLTVSLATH
jgi:uncharacterized membrane protein